MRMENTTTLIMAYNNGTPTFQAIPAYDPAYRFFKSCLASIQASNKLSTIPDLRMSPQLSGYQTFNFSIKTACYIHSNDQSYFRRRPGIPLSKSINVSSIVFTLTTAKYDSTDALDEQAV